MYRTNVFFIFLATLFLSFSAAALAASDAKWAFQVENGIEKSKRSYLLVYYVYTPQRKEERRINVTSTCEKPENTEGVYGKCSHNVTVSPINKQFVLKTGEDVIMLRSPNNNLILATLEYGCCGGPDTARFYAEDGTSLGKLKGFHLRESAGNNAVTRLLDLRNTAEDYLVVTAEGGVGNFEAIDMQSNKPYKILPITSAVKDKDACDYWHLSEFVKYGDRNFITLKVHGSFCSREVLEDQEFSCIKSATAITCMPIQTTNSTVTK